MSILLALLLAASLPQLEQQLKQHQLELEQTRARLEDTRRRIENLTETERTGLARLEALREQAATATRYVAELDAQIAARGEELAILSRQSEQTALRIETYKADISRRLASIYKYGLFLPLQAVFSSARLTDVHRRLMRFRLIARADRRASEELATLRARLLEQRARVSAGRDDLALLRAERIRKQALLEASRRSESTMMAGIRAERDAKRRLEDQLKASAARLENLIADIERTRTEQTGADDHPFAKEKGRLPWPVRGKILARFGSRVDPRYKTNTSNLGIDIETRPGTPVLTIGTGKVAYAEHFMGYGKLVIVDHSGGFYTLYANLEEISVTNGADVEAGTQVGRTADILHFEIRRNGRPTDPLQWLQP